MAGKCRRLGDQLHGCEITRMTDDIRRKPTKADIRPGEVTVALPDRPTPGSISSAASARPGQARKDCPKNAREARESRHGLHHRGRSALGAGAPRGRDLLAPDRALLDGPGPARPRGAGARPIRRAGGPPLRCARRCGRTRSRSPWCELAQGRGHHAFGDRPRLPRRHAAARHQAVFRLDRRHPRRRGRLA